MQSELEVCITQEDFFRFRDFFYRKTGIMFADGKQYFVNKRLRERMRSAGSFNFRDYFNTVRFEMNGLELQSLINTMTVNETYFYREQYQFRCLIDSILPEITSSRDPGETIRIWTVPCSTGEEPYSIALHLLETWPLVDDYNVEIVASDIDTKVLDEACQGIYGERSLQHVPRVTVGRFFKPAGEGLFQVIPEIRNSITFTRVNLFDSLATRSYQDFDVVFCRNLLIYFDDASRREAAEAIYDSLRPGGFVCLGHSESMSRMSSLFDIRKFPEAIVYQRPW